MTLQGINTGSAILMIGAKTVMHSQRVCVCACMCALDSVSPIPFSIGVNNFHLLHVFVSVSETQLLIGV